VVLHWRFLPFFFYSGVISGVYHSLEGKEIADHEPAMNVIMDGYPLFLNSFRLDGSPGQGLKKQSELGVCQSVLSGEEGVLFYLACVEERNEGGERGRRKRGEFIHVYDKNMSDGRIDGWMDGHTESCYRYPFSEAFSLFASARRYVGVCLYFWRRDVLHTLPNHPDNSALFRICFLLLSLL